MPVSQPFSVRLDPDLKRRLDQVARKTDRSSSYLVVKAIEQFLDARHEKQAAIEEALKAADTGEFISSETMNTWVDSWGSGDEIKPGTDIRSE